MLSCVNLHRDIVRYGSMAVLLIASPSIAQNLATPGCVNTPPSTPLPPGCSWVQQSVEENWTSPPISTPTGPEMILLYQDTLDYECQVGEIPCQNYPALPVSIRTTERRTHMYNVGLTVSASAATKLALKLVVDAKASVTVNGSYSNEEVREYEVAIGPFDQAYCTKWHYLDRMEKWQASGSISEAQYRVTWCNSCICGENAVYTYCNKETAAGEAIGYGGRKRDFWWDDACNCWMECGD